MATLSFEWVVCPICHAQFNESNEHLTCSKCGRRFPIVLGIPDLRSVAQYEGPWAEESTLLPAMMAKYPESDLDGLLQDMLGGLEGKSEEDRRQLRDYFISGLPDRARHRAGVIDLLCVRSARKADFSASLEIGCGAGATLFELARRGMPIGVDPNLLHLIIAKKHAETLNLPIRLACGYAEMLPFKNGAFSFVHFTHTFEHFTDQRKGLTEVHRMLLPGGVACFDIPNRFSLWREPHTKVWGIGFVPRQWTALRRIRNQSLWRLRALVGAAFGSNFCIETMMIRFQIPGYLGSRLVKLIGRLLSAGEAVPILRGGIRFFQPGFEIVAWK